MDTLIIQGLNVSAIIGVHAWEQKIKQTLLIDITIHSDFSDIQDNLERTIDYDALCQKVTQYVGTKTFKLIETVAHQVACLIQEQFQVKTIKVAVTKPHAVKNAGVIRVEVER